MMSAAIIPFDFESHAVRSVMIDGLPWFVAVDVCRVLEHSNPTRALARLDDDEKRLIDPNELLGSSVAGGGAQMMNVITQGALFALTFRSTLPVAKRLRRWVTDEVLPAILRDGHYALPGADREELAAKRAYFAALPEAHRDRAEAHAEAVRQIEALIAEGSRVGAAVAQVAADRGLSVRSLYSYRRTVYMVPGTDHGAALAPRWSGPRAMLADCHPEAMALFLDLCRSGVRISDGYRRVVAAAHANGWWPIPAERTLRRVVQRIGAPRSLAKGIA